ncbi:MAG TPA: hypothetical protein VFN22_01935 [Gemmatimonadales bacterium]|nr:hypothetical protein [Gemmatimonadales bacterium]
MPSPAGWREVPCVECGAFVAGIDFGERCPACQRRRAKRVRVITRRVSLAVTAAVAAWVLTRPATSPTSQWAGVIAVPVAYVLTHLIVSRFAMEVLP